MKRILGFFSLLILISCPLQAFKVQQLATGLAVPWGMAFISKHQILFTERRGTAGILNIQSGQVKRIEGLPEVLAQGQGGLLDVAVPPEFQKGGWIYFTYSKNMDDRGVTVLARAKLNNNRLENWHDLIITQSATDTSRHYGSRIAFDDEGYIYFGVGDRGYRPNGQNLKTHAGSILRLKLDGSTPADNPFAETLEAMPEIWSYGHRNPQGLAWDDTHQRLWEIEHGPRGGDEINLILKGQNYGWPVISNGKEYWGPISVGEGKEKAGMQQPIKYYVPSIGPGSLIVYKGDAFPEWKGALISGALKLRHINIIKLNNIGRVQSELRIVKDLNERIRAIAQGPDGYLYFSTDSGKISVITPD